MATQQYRIVSAEDSKSREKLRIEGIRVTGRDGHGRARTHELRLAPDRVAERHRRGLADGYEPLPSRHASSAGG